MIDDILALECQEPVDRAHKDECRAAEAGVAVHAPNRMLELGRPNHVRTA